eukprot:9475522-Pyramimonas_sp.AAC.1
MGERDACGRWHWELRWSSFWGHEACEGCADMGVRDACGRWHRSSGSRDGINNASSSRSSSGSSSSCSSRSS